MTLHVNVNAVLVPVVVRDEQGQSIDDLQQQDFAVFDDGKPRPLSGFLVEKHDLPRKTEQGTGTPEAAAQTVTLPGRITVFVFDDLHLAADQISYAQKASIETLDEALAGSDLAAIVTTSGKINSGLTRDRAILTGAIRAVRPELLFRPDAAECPKLNCRVGGGASGFPDAGHRPPLKLDVRFSRIQLSRRLMLPRCYRRY